MNSFWLSWYRSHQVAPIPNRALGDQQYPIRSGLGAQTTPPRTGGDCTTQARHRARRHRTRKCAPASVALIRASAGRLDGLKRRTKGGTQLRFFLLRQWRRRYQTKKSRPTWDDFEQRGSDHFGSQENLDVCSAGLFPCLLQGRLELSVGQRNPLMTGFAG